MSTLLYLFNVLLYLAVALFAATDVLFFSINSVDLLEIFVFRRMGLSHTKIKRVLDCVAVFFALLLLSPVFIAIILAVKIDLPEKKFFYISSKTSLINVNLLVINEQGEILLSCCDDEYCGTGWNITGGIIRHGEIMKNRLKITAERELGLIPMFEDTPCKIYLEYDSFDSRA